MLPTLICASVARQCTLNNTVPGPDGTCICKRGYVGPTPLTKHGCWTCSPICSPNALCHYPGYCRCRPGFYGDGVTGCRPSTDPPELLDFSPRAARQNGRSFVTISFKPPANVTVETAFARFGNLVSPCSVPAPGTMTCVIPPGSGTVSLQISLDGTHWSTSTDVFTYLPGMISSSSFLSIFTLACAIAAGILLACMRMRDQHQVAPKAFAGAHEMIPPARFI